MKRARESGVILINVLMFVAIASGIVLMMVTREEGALDRAVRVREAARALAAVRGGELTALAALRRDTTPELDYPGEAWGAVGQREVAIAGGRFELAVADAQARFNINNLRDGRGDTAAIFIRIATTLGLPEDAIAATIALVRGNGPVRDLGPLRLAGYDPAVLARATATLTALPGTTPVNLNTASPELVAMLVSDPAAAERLLGLRERHGYLTRADVTDAGVFLPSGVSFASDSFWVRTRVTMGDTRQQEAALILRRPGPNGVANVSVAARWRNAAIPPDAPPLAGGE